MVWHKVDKVERFGAGWIVRYSILSCCSTFHKTLVIEQQEKPTTKQIEDAINNRG